MYRVAVSDEESLAVGLFSGVWWCSKQAEKSARVILRELEDGKLAGQDYPISSLIRLRQVLNAPGPSFRRE